jgi:hypothetical protein
MTIMSSSLDADVVGTCFGVCLGGQTNPSPTVDVKGRDVFI